MYMYGVFSGNGTGAEFTLGGARSRFDRCRFGGRFSRRERATHTHGSESGGIFAFRVMHHLAAAARGSLAVARCRRIKTFLGDTRSQVHARFHDVDFREIREKRRRQEGKHTRENKKLAENVDNDAVLGNSCSGNKNVCVCRSFMCISHREKKNQGGEEREAQIQQEGHTGEEKIYEILFVRSRSRRIPATTESDKN